MVFHAVEIATIGLPDFGRRGLPDAIPGSVAEKLVRTSPLPVLTVHGTKEKV
jgi:nucleotide-binding universal stress UspA family protein